MKIAKIGKHELSGDFGWYTGNEFRILGIEILHRMADYPVGWMTWVILEIQIGHLVIGLYFNHGRNL